MARSRTGGTTGLLSGKLGDIIYQITRNSDGSFRQSMTSNPETRENPNTDEQARARLTMATMERAMFTFRPIMGTGFENVAEGTNQVSKFSQINYNFYKGLIDEAWNSGTPHLVRLDLPLKGQSVPKDGEFIISQGSLRPIVGFDGSRGGGSNVHFQFKMVQLNNYRTLKDALWETRVYIGDQIAGLLFGIGSTPSKSALVWFVMYTDRDLSPATIITKQNWRNIIRFNSNVPINTFWNESDNCIYVSAEHLEQYGISNWGCVGWRRRNVVRNKVCYSNQQMVMSRPNPWSTWGWKDVSDVKNSWLEL